MRTSSFGRFLSATAISALLLSACSGEAPSTSETPTTSDASTVSVGILQSLSGTMAISEITVKNAEILAIEEINAAGGVLGKQITAIVEDGASDPASFAQKASKLIENSNVATVFGGWTSASRKAMLPVFERTNNLLWYPVQFEGNECSPNIMYSGAQPNQQILPAFEWAVDAGYENYFLIGSDYVFPRTANLIVKKHIENKELSLAGEAYVPLGGTDFSGVIAKVQAAKPDIIFNTLNGDSNVAFFKQLKAAGIASTETPIMSFSIGEQEAQAMGPSLVEGSYATWNYFQSLETAENNSFVDAYKAKFGAGAAITDPMVHGYLNVYAWKAAAEKAGTFDVDAVREAVVELEAFSTPMGMVSFADNQSLVQKALIGKLDASGQFEIIADSGDAISPEPYDALTFPGKVCEL
ncbi:urea ABC transporter substrate-binding protein [Hirschia litorea]|uniref:Urea ABC transporter substrate-binding protein n=1 Tax=Hirschia litorea TaxID=1199156 RepID=A0ABW2INY8_9PROT